MENESQGWGEETGGGDGSETGAVRKKKKTSMTGIGTSLTGDKQEVNIINMSHCT